MNKLISTTSPTTISRSELILNSLSHLDSKVLLILAGMASFTTISCIGFISLSKSEMTLSRDGLSITQPTVNA